MRKSLVRVMVGTSTSMRAATGAETTSEAAAVPHGQAQPGLHGGADGQDRHGRRGQVAKKCRRQGRRGRHTPLDQPLTKQGPRLCQPAAELALAPTELLGRFVLSPPFQQTQQQWTAMLLGQTSQFLVEDCLQLPPGHVRQGIGRSLAFLPLGLLAVPGSLGACLKGDAAGRPMQEAGDRLGLAERCRLAGEDQEGGLQGVLGVLDVMQHLPADAPDHRPMPLDQRGEGLFIVEPDQLHQLAVGKPAQLGAARQRAEMLQDQAGG